MSIWEVKAAKTTAARVQKHTASKKNNSTGRGGDNLIGREEHMDSVCGIIYKKPKERCQHCFKGKRPR